MHTEGLGHPDHSGEPTMRWGETLRGPVPARRPSRAVVAVLGNPVVVILVLAGIFDGLSGNPIHSILLFAVAVALAWDGLARHRIRPGLSPAVGPTEPAGLDRTGAITGIEPTLAERKGSVLPAPVVAI